jgi:hypothetical protein
VAGQAPAQNFKWAKWLWLNFHHSARREIFTILFVLIAFGRNPGKEMTDGWQVAVWYMYVHDISFAHSS